MQSCCYIDDINLSTMKSRLRNNKGQKPSVEKNSKYF